MYYYFRSIKFTLTSWLVFFYIFFLKNYSSKWHCCINKTLKLIVHEKCLMMEMFLNESYSYYFFQKLLNSTIWDTVETIEASIILDAFAKAWLAVECWCVYYYHVFFFFFLSKAEWRSKGDRPKFSPKVSTGPQEEQTKPTSLLLASCYRSKCNSNSFSFSILAPVHEQI